MSTDGVLRGLRGEAKGVVRQLLREGWTVSTTGSNHVRVTHPNGTSLFVALTSSSRNSIHHIRRNIRRIREGKQPT